MTRKALITIADTAGKYADLGLRSLPDATPGQGPLSGLEAAALDCDGSSWLLLLSCDLIDVRPSWVASLLRLRTDAAWCVAFRPGGLWQPLLALYQPAALPIVQRRLVEHLLRMQALLDELRAIEAPIPDDWPRLLQVNTLDALPGHCSGRGSSRHFPTPREHAHSDPRLSRRRGATHRS